MHCNGPLPQVLTLPLLWVVIAIVDVLVVFAPINVIVVMIISVHHHGCCF